MTYANDCIHERKRGLKRITDQTGAELNAAIDKAVKKYGDDFWLLLHGIDAYIERRSRRIKRVHDRFARFDTWDRQQ